MNYLGIDTSNYTTSCAWLCGDTMEIIQQKQLLPVPEGQAGLRQSDAVFHHTRQLPALMEQLFADHTHPLPDGIGVSVAPRSAQGSYMPCFLAGQAAARSIAAVNGCKLYETSHQMGHILAALYSADRLEWLNPLRRPFLAFHVSGGTTDCVLCTPNSTELLQITPVSASLDLKAGQAIDRVGLMLGLSFPAGPALEQLAAQSDSKQKAVVRLKDGCCSLSGLENQCSALLKKGTPPCDIAKYCLNTVAAVLTAMTKAATQQHPEAAVLYAGGVMSNRLIRAQLEKLPMETAFAQPAFSCDNAAGIALYAALRHRGETLCPY